MVIKQKFSHRNELQQAHLVHVDGNGDDDVEQVTKSQAANQDVGPVPHALVLVDYSEQRGVADDPHHEDQAGHKGVDVLEGVLDLRLLDAHGGDGGPRPGWLQGQVGGDGAVVLGGLRDGCGPGVADEARRSDFGRHQEAEQSDGPHLLAEISSGGKNFASLLLYTERLLTRWSLV